MAAYRKISVTFWSDSFVQSLTPEGKYFYLYLMTNTRTTQCGIYEITISQMCFETGYNQSTIDKLLTQFQKTGKIKYSKETNEIALKNWPKYNESESPKVYACVKKELKLVKNKVLIQYLYSMDTNPQETKEETKEEAEEQKENVSKNFEWFLKQFDEMFVETLKMTHRGKDFMQAAKESFAHLAADPIRLKMAESQDCKKLLNTWLTNQKIKPNGIEKLKSNIDAGLANIEAKYGNPVK